LVITSLIIITPTLILIICHYIFILAECVVITLAGFMLFIICLYGILVFENQFFTDNS